MLVPQGPHVAATQCLSKLCPYSHQVKAEQKLVELQRRHREERHSFKFALGNFLDELVCSFELIVGRNQRRCGYLS